MRISIVTFDGFNEIDTFVLLGIFNQMRSDGWRADIVCAGPKITSAGNVVVASQRPLEWANDSDVVLFGNSSRTREIAADNKTMGRLQLDPSQQLLGAQCTGSLILQALGMLPDMHVCAEQPSMAWLIQAGLKPVVTPLRANGNVATAGGRLAASYLAAWVIWRLDGDLAARHALYRVAPAGEEESFIAHVFDVVRPFIDGAEDAMNQADDSDASWETVPQAELIAVVDPISTPVEFATDSAEVSPELDVAPRRPVIPLPGFSGSSEPVFSGIVQATGKIATVQPMPGGVLRVMVVTEQFDLDKLEAGNRIAVNGMCVEVVAKTVRSFKYDLSSEIVDKTTGLEQPGNEVNLERPLKPGMRVGGHLLGAKVDGIGEVLKFAQMGECWQLVVQVDKHLGERIAAKGSIALNGVSLTVNHVKDVKDRCIFSVNLIPHTLDVTALKTLQAGAMVNVEIDMIAQHLHEMRGAADVTVAGKARRVAR